MPLRADEWAVIAGLGTLPFLIMELWKAWSRSKGVRKRQPALFDGSSPQKSPRRRETEGEPAGPSRDSGLAVQQKRS